MTAECSKESGTCDKCRSACRTKPGWFKPDEAERAAQFLNLSLPAFFERYLMVDWWQADSDLEETFLLSPAIKGGQAGEEFSRNPSGECVFFEKGLCAIHPVKPFECRSYWCGSSGTGFHLEAARVWVDHQKQVHELLGREPEAQGGWSLLDQLSVS